jgi:antagonist of KipI
VSAGVIRTIRVETPGLFTTVQDLGRAGFGPLGVSAAGAADAISLRIGNRLVGNAENVAGLEMTLLGGTFSFPEGAVVALTGSDFEATLDGVAAETWASFEVKAGQTLRLGLSRSGARGYLCVGGGIHVPEFLGSASTHVLSGLGGFAGRALRKGDALEVGDISSERRKFVSRRVSLEGLERLRPHHVLRVTPGPQGEWFSETAKRVLYESNYRVAEESNRMGLRLEGVAIAADAARGEMITEGVSLGAIQVPENGLPIILFVDQQTTGGYPKIANVIAADMASVGQMRPRDEVRFEEVDWEQAGTLLREQEGLLQSKELILG